MEETSVYHLYIPVFHGVAAWDKVGGATVFLFSFQSDLVWEAWETLTWGAKQNEEASEPHDVKNLCKPTWNTDIRIRLWLQTGRLVRFEAMDLGRSILFPSLC